MDDARAAAFADLVVGVLAIRTDHASARFDLELARAEAAGTIDAETARTLRWWQRESVRAVSDHVSRVLPEVLTEVEAADGEAADQVAESADAWATATALAALPGSAEAVPAAPVVPPTVEPPSGPPVATVTPLSAAPSAAPSTPAAPAPQTPSAPPDPGGPFRPVPPEPLDPAPRASTTPRRTPPPGRGPSGTGAPSRRTLVAGLTVLGDERGPDRP